MSFQILVKKIQDAFLRVLTTTMRHVPQFGFKFVTSMLTFPCIVHILEGLLDSCHRKQHILLTNEKGLSPDDERPKNCFQLYYSVINVVILRGGSCRLPDVTPTGFNVSPETSEVRYMCH